MMKSSSGSVRRERPTSVVILAAANEVDKIGDGGRRPHWLKICLSVLFIVSAVIIIVSSECSGCVIPAFCFEHGKQT